MAGLDLAREVTPAAMSEHGDGDGPRIAVIDTGIKGSIVRNLVARGARVELHPCTATAAELTANDPDAIFLANGPGDPAALGYVVAHRARARRHAAGVGHLPGPPAAVPGRRPRDLQARLRPPRRQPPGQGPAHGQDRDHLPEPRLRRARAGRGRARGGRRAGALGDRLRRGGPDPRQPLRPHGRGPRAARGRERHRPVPPRGRARAPTTPCTSSTASWRPSVPRRDDLHKHPHPRLGADRHRPGGRVRLLRRAGVQGPQGGGLRDRPGQLEPGDDHDRPRVRRRRPTSSRCCPGRWRRSSSASAPTRCCRPSAARPR